MRFSSDIRPTDSLNLRGYFMSMRKSRALAGVTQSRRWPGHPHRRLLGWFALAVALDANLALAQAPHRAHPASAREAEYLTLERALLEAASKHPRLRVTEASRRSTEQAVEAAGAGLRQVPQFQAQLGPRISGGQAFTDVTLSLSQSLPTSNLGRAQKELAHAEQGVLAAELQQAKLEAAFDAGQSYVDLALAEELLDLRSEAAREMEATNRLTNARVQTGEADPGEAALASSEWSVARAAVLAAEDDHYRAAARLAYATGRPSSSRVEVAERLSELFMQAIQDDGTSASAKQGNHPALLAARQVSAASDKLVELTAASQVPTFALGVQYEREGTGDQIVSGVVSVPVPLFRPWRFGELRQRAVADRDRATIDLVRRQLGQAVQDASHELSHAKARLQLLEQEALPASGEAVRIARAKYESGETDLLRLSLARRAHLATRERVADARASFARAQLWLRSLSGQLLEELP